jgi:putative Holliday junction resolvase
VAQSVPRILAVDWGERRIGLAVSDPQGIIATGLRTLVVRGTADALTRIAAIAVEREAERIVVGLPLLMSGARGEAAESAQRFADALAARTGLPVDTYDERLTSALSERRLREVGARRARTRVDQGAAVALLESYLLRVRSAAAAAEASGEARAPSEPAAGPGPGGGPRKDGAR